MNSFFFNLMAIAALGFSESFAYLSLLLSAFGIFLFFRYLPRWMGAGASSQKKSLSEESTPSGDTFILVGGEQKGPYSQEQILHLLTSEQIDATTLYWKPGESRWEPVSKLFGVPASEKNEEKL